MYEVGAEPSRCDYALIYLQPIHRANRLRVRALLTAYLISVGSRLVAGTKLPVASGIRFLRQGQNFSLPALTCCSMQTVVPLFVLLPLPG